MPGRIGDGMSGPSPASRGDKIHCPSLAYAVALLPPPPPPLCVITYNTKITRAGRRINAAYKHYGVEGQDYVIKDENNKRALPNDGISRCHKWHILLRKTPLPRLHTATS